MEKARSIVSHFHHQMNLVVDLEKREIRPRECDKTPWKETIAQAITETFLFDQTFMTVDLPSW